MRRRIHVLHLQYHLFDIACQNHPLAQMVAIVSLFFVCVCHEAAIYSDSLFQFYVQMVNWLVVSTHLRNVSQLGSFIPNIQKK